MDFRATSAGEGWLAGRVLKRMKNVNANTARQNVNKITLWRCKTPEGEAERIRLREAQRRREIFACCLSVNDMFDMFVDLVHTIFEANVPMKSKREMPGTACIQRIRGLQAELLRTADDARVSQLGKKLVKLCRRKRILFEHSVLRSTNPSSVHK